LIFGGFGNWLEQLKPACEHLNTERKILEVAELANAIIIFASVIN